MEFVSGFTVHFIYKALPALLNCFYPAFVKNPKKREEWRKKEKYGINLTRKNN